MRRVLRLEGDVRRVHSPKMYKLKFQVFRIPQLVFLHELDGSRLDMRGVEATRREIPTGVFSFIKTPVGISLSPPHVESRTVKLVQKSQLGNSSRALGEINRRADPAPHSATRANDRSTPRRRPHRRTRERTNEWNRKHAKKIKNGIDVCAREAHRRVVRRWSRRRTRHPSESRWRRDRKRRAVVDDDAGEGAATGQARVAIERNVFQSWTSDDHAEWVRDDAAGSTRQRVELDG